METLHAVLMGLVEGLTEFLPISSTGHLILAGHLLDFDRIMGGKEKAQAFEIVIQLGAILAVVAAYPGRFIGLLRFNDHRGLSGFRGLGLLAITSFPAALSALAARKLIHEKLFNPGTVALALAVGAIWIFVVEWLQRKYGAQPLSAVKDDGAQPPSAVKDAHARPGAAVLHGVDAITWKQALAVGLFQCLSLWPGMSRSASTILGGMMSGLDRKTATEYSFFAAVPIMTAATCYEFYKSYHALDAAQLGLFAVGFVVSFISAWAAVKFLIHFVARHTLVPFGWYRLAVAGLVAWRLAF